MDINLGKGIAKIRFDILHLKTLTNILKVRERNRDVNIRVDSKFKGIDA